MSFMEMGIGGSITLGPAGPPLHRGVLVVPQSAQLFFGSLTWLSSDETASGFLLSMPSDSDPCTRKENGMTWGSQIRKETHYKEGDEHSLSHSDPPSPPPLPEIRSKPRSNSSSGYSLFHRPPLKITQMETKIYPSFGQAQQLAFIEARDLKCRNHPENSARQEKKQRKGMAPEMQ